MNSTPTSPLLTDLAAGINPRTGLPLDMGDPCLQPEVVAALHTAIEVLDLMHAIGGYPKRHRHPWTPEDLYQLATLRAQGVLLPLIAMNLQRSEDAIRFKFGLPPSKPSAPVQLLLPSSARTVLRALCKGRDPIAGLPLLSGHIGLEPVVREALAAALTALEVAARHEFGAWPARHGAPWEPNEEQMAVLAFSNGTSIEEIARLFQRSAAAIYAVLVQHGVNLGTPSDPPDVEPEDEADPVDYDAEEIPPAGFDEEWDADERAETLADEIRR